MVLFCLKVLIAIGNFCISSIAVGMIIEIIVIYPIQRRKYRPGIDNLLVLLIWRNSNSHADSFICDNTHEELQIIVAGAITKK